MKVPVTGGAEAGDEGPWMSTVPVNVALNPGGREPVPHSMALVEIATAVKPDPPDGQNGLVFAGNPPNPPFPAVEKFQPAGAMNVTV